jgi:hypothetical protein
MFVFLPVQQPLGHSGQIQGIDRKLNGHVWNKVKMTNIKKKSNLVLGSLDAWGI